MVKSSFTHFLSGRVVYSTPPQSSGEWGITESHTHKSPDGLPERRGDSFACAISSSFVWGRLTLPNEIFVAA